MMMKLHSVNWNKSDNSVSLTMTSENGHTMSLYLSPEECEKMIRMIRAAYTVETEYNRCIVCGDPKGHYGNKCNMFELDPRN